RALAPSPDQRFANAVEMLAALEAEIGRMGAGREALVRELAAKVHRLAPGEETFASGSPRVATVPTAVDADPARESYFRDHRSAAFVESMLESVPAPSRAGALRWAAALAGGAALIAAAVWGLRSGRVGEAAPPPAAGISVAPAPSAGAQSTRPAE